MRRAIGAALHPLAAADVYVTVSRASSTYGQRHSFSARSVSATGLGHAPLTFARRNGVHLTVVQVGTGLRGPRATRLFRFSGSTPRDIDSRFPSDHLAHDGATGVSIAASFPNCISGLLRWPVVQ